MIMIIERNLKLRVITVSHEQGKSNKEGCVLYRYTQKQEDSESYLAKVLSEGLERVWNLQGGNVTLKEWAYFRDTDLEVGKANETSGKKHKKIWFILSPAHPEDLPSTSFKPMRISMTWYYNDDVYAGAEDELVIPCQYDVDKTDELIDSMHAIIQF